MLTVKKFGEYVSGHADYERSGSKYKLVAAKEAFGLIVLSLGQVALEKVTMQFPDMDDPAGAWRVVCSLYEGTDRATRRALRQSLFTDRMSNDETVTAYINRKKAVVNRLVAGGKDTIGDEQLQDYILAGLTPKYENIVTQHMFADISLARTEDLLREFDQLLINSVTQAIEMPPGDTGYLDTGGLGAAHAVKYGKSKNRGERTCFNCGNYGHYKSECRAPGGGQHQQAKQEMEENGTAKYVSSWRTSGQSTWEDDAGAIIM